jgi:hypothetical protein
MKGGATHILKSFFFFFNYSFSDVTMTFNSYFHSHVKKLVL